MPTTISEIAALIFTANLLRYLIIVIPFFLIFYVFYRQKWNFRKIQDKFPKGKDIRREALYSLATIAIFTLIGLLVFATPIREYTLRYDNISDYGWAYWVLSIVLMIFLHDTYFYWAHRAMHYPPLFKYFHLVHHKSTNPSPWAAYAFHPLEGIVEASIIFPIVFLIPFHPSAIAIFLFFMMIYNVYGHLGYELYPKGFNKHPIGKWLNTSVNHNQHHKFFTGNFGLYFLFWDRWMGTIREDYDQGFLAVDQKRRKTP
ncbi:MAG: sterol desaturase family protein [Bacteroidia bacterium]|nr:sterol desaturase family protein [Bacteroidia bacterium]